MSQKSRIPECDSAVHIVKGAVVRVAGAEASVTISTQCHKKNEGRLTIQWSRGALSQSQLQRIEAEANGVRQRNLIIEVTPMKREDAEEKYKNSLVNHTWIYDKLPVPKEVSEVNVLEIKDWNVNCCSGTHLKQTGDIRYIKITRQNVREQKQELEIVFELTDDIQGASTHSTNLDQSVADTDDVTYVSNQILDDFLKEVKTHQPTGITDQEGLIIALQPKLEQRLTLLKNMVYFKGFMSRPPGV